MKTILFLIQKEFLQIFRDRFMAGLIFAMPIIQLLILANAATFEIENLRVHIIDRDGSHTSKRLINKLEGSDYFYISSSSFDDKTGYLMVEKDKTDLILKIPSGFEYHLAKNHLGQIQVLINGINGTKGGLANAYINATVADFNTVIRTEWLNKYAHAGLENFTIDHRNWYNPGEDYRIFMVPGILVALVTILAMFLSALNIVREKEIGTIEQLNVTTIKKHEFIIGKLVPFGIIALVVLALGLVVARFVFHVPIAGNPGLLFLFAGLYVITALGLGIFISTISSSQQQAMFTSFFFMMIFILMSGLFTPIESMPDWAQAISRINPLSYFIRFMRMVLLKGSGFAEVQHLFLAMGLYAVLANLLGMLSYRKTIR